MHGGVGEKISGGWGERGKGGLSSVKGSGGWKGEGGRGAGGRGAGREGVGE